MKYPLIKNTNGNHYKQYKYGNKKCDNEDNECGIALSNINTEEKDNLKDKNI